ncbi:MAG: hypothetical protein ABI464_06380 [Chthoniobacteraceae bacterium]
MMRPFLLLPCLALFASIMPLHSTAGGEAIPDDWVESERKFIQNHAISITFRERASDYPLRVAVEKLPNTPRIGYDEITVQAYDSNGTELKVAKLHAAMSVYLEARAGVTVATGFYVISKKENSRPDHFEVHWKKSRISLRLVK